MNETEYLISRIKDLERTVKSPDLPISFKNNQLTALLNYRSELERLKNDSFRN